MNSLRNLVHRGYIQNVYRKSKSLNLTSVSPLSVPSPSFRPIPGITPNTGFRSPPVDFKLPPIPEDMPEKPLFCDECLRQCRNTGDECFIKCKICKNRYITYICDDCRMKNYICKNCKNNPVKNDEFNIESVVKFISNKISVFFKI